MLKIKNFTLRKLLNRILPPFVLRNLEGRESLFKIFLNINWLALEKIFKFLVNFLIVVYEARYLGPDNYGKIGYALAFVMLFSSLSNLGMDSVLIRNITHYPSKILQYLGTVFISRLLSSLLIILLSTVFIIITKPDDQNVQLYVLIISIGFLFKSFDTIDLYFQSQVQSKYSVIGRSISTFIVSMAKAYFIIWEKDVLLFVVIIAVEYVLNALAFSFLYKKKLGFGLLKWKFKLSILRELFYECWPIIISGSASLIMFNIDQVMVGNLLSSDELGQYTLSRKIIDIMAIVSVMTVSSFAPAIAKGKKMGEEEFHKRLLKLYRGLFFITLMLCIAIIALSGFFVPLIWGKEYQRAQEILVVLSFRLIFNGILLIRNTYITNESLFKYSLLSLFVGTVINIALNWLFIPKMQSEGTVYATYISLLISVFLIDFFHKKARINLFIFLNAVFNFKNNLLYIKAIFNK